MRCQNLIVTVKVCSTWNCYNSWFWATEESIQKYFFGKV